MGYDVGSVSQRFFKKLLDFYDYIFYNSERIESYSSLDPELMNNRSTYSYFRPFKIEHGLRTKRCLSVNSG